MISCLVVRKKTTSNLVPFLKCWSVPTVLCLLVPVFKVAVSHKITDYQLHTPHKALNSWRYPFLLFFIPETIIWRPRFVLYIFFYFNVAKLKLTVGIVSALSLGGQRLWNGDGTWDQDFDCWIVRDGRGVCTMHIGWSMPVSCELFYFAQETPLVIK